MGKHLNHFCGDAPYVVCQVERGDKQAKGVAPHFKTKSVKSLEPVWNEAHELDPVHPEDSIKFTILDKGLIGSKTEGIINMLAESFFHTGFSGQMSVPNKPEAKINIAITPLGASNGNATQLPSPVMAEPVIAVAQPVSPYASATFSAVPPPFAAMPPFAVGGALANMG